MIGFRMGRVVLIAAFGFLSQGVSAGAFVPGSLTGAPTQLAETPLLSKSFGSVTVGGTVSGAPETVTVHVTTPPGGQVDITDISISGLNGGDFQITGGSCVNASGLSNNDTCTLNLNFSPSAPGARTSSRFRASAMKNGERSMPRQLTP